MDPESLFLLLFGAGGTGAIAGLWTILQGLKKGKLDKEETLIRRLDEDNRRQANRAREAEKRADDAEADAARYRRQRIKAQEQAARFRRRLISIGAESGELEDLEEYND